MSRRPSQGQHESLSDYWEREKVWEQQQEILEAQQKANELAEQRSNYTPQGLQAVQKVVKDWRDEIVYNQLKDEIKSLKNEIMYLRIEKNKLEFEHMKEINALRHAVRIINKQALEEGEKFIEDAFAVPDESEDDNDR